MNLRRSILDRPRGTIRQVAHAISTAEPGNQTEEEVADELTQALFSGAFDGRMFHPDQPDESWTKEDLRDCLMSFLRLNPANFDFEEHAGVGPSPIIRASVQKSPFADPHGPHGRPFIRIPSFKRLSKMKTAQHKADFRAWLERLELAIPAVKEWLGGGAIPRQQALVLSIAQELWGGDGRPPLRMAEKERNERIRDRMKEQHILPIPGRGTFYRAFQRFGKAQAEH